MRTFALIGLVALLAGCVPLAPVHFARENTVEGQRQQDFNQCWYEGVLINPHPAYASIRATACMIARGYTRRDCRRCPPGGVVANLPANQRQATTPAPAPTYPRAAANAEIPIAEMMFLSEALRVGIEEKGIDPLVALRQAKQRHSEVYGNKPELYRQFDELVVFVWEWQGGEEGYVRCYMRGLQIGTTLHNQCVQEWQRGEREAGSTD